MTKSELQNIIIKMMLTQADKLNCKNCFHVRSDCGKFSFVGNASIAFRIQGAVIRNMVNEPIPGVFEFFEAWDVTLAVEMLHNVKIDCLGSDVLITWLGFYEE
jgi:hypothetical protein